MHAHIYVWIKIDVHNLSTNANRIPHTQGQGAEAERLAERGYRIFREKIVHSPYQQQQVRRAVVGVLVLGSGQGVFWCIYT